jgi:hypothetical protein
LCAPDAGGLPLLVHDDTVCRHFFIIHVSWSLKCVVESVALMGCCGHIYVSKRGRIEQLASQD